MKFDYHSQKIFDQHTQPCSRDRDTYLPHERLGLGPPVGLILLQKSTRTTKFKVTI